MGYPIPAISRLGPFLNIKNASPIYFPRPELRVFDVSNSDAEAPDWFSPGATGAPSNGGGKPMGLVSSDHKVRATF